MKQHFFASASRGIKNGDWLQSKFHFSFSDYYNPTASAFGTLVAFNDDHLATGKGFGTHPHINMEIISVLLKGKMNHKDSMGYSTVIEEGGVQIMSAGSGLFHEEYNIGEDDVHFLQIWIEPKQQNIRPRYQTRSFPKAARHNQLKTIVSHEEGLEHCWINQNTRLSLGYFEAGKVVTYAFHKVNKCVFLFVMSGEVAVEETVCKEGDALGLWDGEAFTVRCQTDTEFIVIETPVNQK